MGKSRALASLALVLACLSPMAPGAQRTVPLTTGMVLDRSVTIRPGRYQLAASADLATPAITIRGSNITVDFNGAVLAGTADGVDPDTMAGVGILVDRGSSVTVKNAVIRGYKVGILARDSPGLKLAHNDLSYNWKERLRSGIEKESLLDWMSYHQNEKDEWLRYGAAIYLAGCDGAEVEGNIAIQGQNGLMVTRSSGLKIWNNTFQFLSAIGVGFYRVTKTTVQHNRIDWCVRGYSHGFYNRGQDSAGLLMYEQSSNNTVAYNSITHGGDGLFLWAGQSTMDGGKGGSNDNVFYENDFSHAPTNGIETTFSRNVFIGNRVEECWHGVWGGYSWDSYWGRNRFARNTEAIAIEHGQNNVIAGNTFDGDATAIRLWQNPTQDPSWGYAKSRDTKSHGYRIEANTFRGNTTALDVRNTADAALFANSFDKVDTNITLRGETPGFTISSAPSGSVEKTVTVPAMPGGIDPMIKDGERRGRETIVVDEWGPYDWKSPKLWPVLDQPAMKGPLNTVPAWTQPLRLRVLGPAGQWKLGVARGATVSPSSGSVPGELTLTPDRGGVVDYEVALEYRGAEVVSPRGAKTPAGAPYTFRYSRFFVPVDWQIRFFDFTDAADPVKQPNAFEKRLAGAAVKTIAHDRLDYMSGRNFEEGVGRDRFAFVAEGTADLPPGDYTLTVVSDDGARVWIDGERVLDAWEPHGSRVDTVAVSGGRRRFKVVYYELGGFAEMRFDIQRR